MDQFVDAAALLSRFGLAFVFLISSVPKLLARPAFERAVRNYALLPASFVRPVAAWLPRVELTCALALLLGVGVPAVGIASASLLAVFAAAVAINLARGREIDCGCQGSVAPRQIRWELVAGDMALAGLATFAAIANPDVLSFGVPKFLSGPSSLTSRDAVALLLLAGTLVVGQLVLSSWRNLTSATKETRSL
jgi:Methylamine utilisation protein MauE